MAASFKQQCPSCEAMVLVKDASQVGKKVDCPRCKYRFVVEAPAKGQKAEEDNGEAEIKDEAKTKPKAGQTVTTQKPGPAQASPTIRKKTGPRKSDDADEPKSKKKKPQNSGSMVLILGIGMSVCAVALLGFGAYVIFFNTDKDDRGVRVPTLRETKPVVDTEPEKKTGTALAEITNLLPSDTQGIISVNVKDLVHGAVGRAAFNTPGAFTPEFFERRFGLRADEVDQLLVAENFSKGWVYAVIRTSKPIKVPELAAALDWKPGDGSIRGQEYFTAERSAWLDNLGKLLSDARPALQLAPPTQLRKPFIRVVDPQTLVMADEEPLKALLNAGGKFPSMAPAPVAAKGPRGRPAEQPNKTFLTVSPDLKALIDKMEMAQRPLIGFAWQVEPILQNLEKAADALKPSGLADEKLLVMLRGLVASGVCLNLRDSTVLTLGLEGREPNFARTTLQQLRTQAESLDQAGAFRMANVRVEWDGRPLVPASAPRPKGEGLAPVDAKVSVRPVPADHVLVLNVELPIGGTLDVQSFLQPQMLVLRGLADMADTSPRLHELGEAVKKLGEKGNLPRGAFDRPIDPKRQGRPYPPTERVSWMADLLPFLGYEKVRGRIKVDQSWKSPVNALSGMVLVPPFLDPQSPPGSWWVQPPSLPGRMYGATHFVGIAGVGLDAAEYDQADPAMAKKLGILGYDRATALADIKDGTSNTILMLQVPPTYKRPWIAGGGATLAGVPETDSIRPFVSTYGDKRGTYAVMADGSVRFISANISDEAFKAMCTAQGAEKMELEKDAPLVPAPKAVLKAQP